jgi:hypothetical protein
VGGFWGQFFWFGARCMKAQRGHILGIITGCFKFFWVRQIWGLFWSKESVHQGFLRWWFLRGYIWGPVGSSFGSVCKLHSRMPRCPNWKLAYKHMRWKNIEWINNAWRPSLNNHHQQLVMPPPPS